jgi:hypothetical protein
MRTMWVATTPPQVPRVPGAVRVGLLFPTRWDDALLEVTYELLARHVVRLVHLVHLTFTRLTRVVVVGRRGCAPRPRPRWPSCSSTSRAPRPSRAAASRASPRRRGAPAASGEQRRPSDMHVACEVK